MILRYRVSLPNIKGFLRVYDIKSDMTLYEFHKLLRDDLDLLHDQLIQFKALGQDENDLIARYGLFDLGAGAVDEVSFEKTRSLGVQSFIYFYDVTNKLYLIVTFDSEQEEEKSKLYPELVESKGPKPIEFLNGYVAFEDRVDTRTANLSSKKKSVIDDEDFDDEDFDDEDTDNDDDEIFEEELI